MEALEGRWGIARSKALAERASTDLKLREELIEALWSINDSDRTRAADALMRLSESAPQLFEPYLPALLEVFYSPLPQIMQWHVLLMVPRIRMGARDRKRAFAFLKEFLSEEGSIVRTAAIEGLARLGLADRDLREEAVWLVGHTALQGTPAMKARARHWLKKLERT